MDNFVLILYQHYILEATLFSDSSYSYLASKVVRDVSFVNNKLHNLDDDTNSDKSWILWLRL